MKTIFTTAAILIQMTVFALPAPPEEFKAALQRVISSATHHKFENLKGEMMESVRKGYNTIQKFGVKDSLPGSIQNYLNVSFGQSFRSVLMVSNEMNQEIKTAFEEYLTLVKNALPECWWHYNETSSPEKYKSFSSSRKQKNEINTYPDINLEIVYRNGQYVLQLSLNV